MSYLGCFGARGVGGDVVAARVIVTSSSAAMKLIASATPAEGQTPVRSAIEGTVSARPLSP
jgi:hypothetical protein